LHDRGGPPVSGPPEVRIAIGSVSDPPSEPYTRMLITRGWPRGMARATVDQWDRDLAPSDELLEAYRAGRVTTAEFARRYREEMASRRSLVAWAARMAAGNGVTLLCACEGEERCHREVLAAIIREQVGEGMTRVV
jgi:uncharacterized protein YeaO (DUF488 family)